MLISELTAELVLRPHAMPLIGSVTQLYVCVICRRSLSYCLD